MSYEWCSNIPLRDLLIEPVRNGVYKPKEFHGRGCKIVNMGELFAHSRLFDVEMKRIELTEKELEKSTIQTGDLLFARRSLVASGAGKCTIVKHVNEPTTFESSIIRARPNKRRASSDYLYYFFSSSLGRELMGTILRQVAVSGITGSDLMNLEIPCPSLRAQNALSALLSNFDDRIDLLKQTNQTLEAIAQTIFKSWFVNFDPVHAKQQGIACAGIDAETAALFPDRFEDSELGLIPKGWDVASLDQIASYLNGLALQKFPPKDDDWLPVIKIAQLRKGDCEGADKAGAYIKPEYIINDGDVLFSWSGTLEVDIWCGGKGALNQHLFKVTSAEYKKWFYYYWTKYHLIDFRNIAAGKATTMGHIQRSHLHAAKVVIPSLEIMNKANDVLQPIIDKQISNAVQVKNLSSLRDTLLPRLISGKLDVSAIEAQLEEIA